MQTAVQRTFDYLSDMQNLVYSHQNILQEQKYKLGSLHNIVALHNNFNTVPFNPHKPFLSIKKMDLTPFKHRSLEQLTPWLDFDVQNPMAEPRFKEYILADNCTDELDKLLRKQERLKEKECETASPIKKMGIRTQIKELQRELDKLQNSRKIFFAEKITPAFRDDMLSSWYSWSNHARFVVENNRIYRELFFLHQDFLSSGNLLDLACTHYLLSGIYDTINECQPLIYSILQVSFDAQQDAFTLSPQPNGLKINTALLQKISTNPYNNLQKVEEILKKANLFVAETRHHVLKELSSLLPPTVQILDASHFTPNEILGNEKLAIYETELFFTEDKIIKKWQRDYEQLLSYLKNGGAVPDTVRHLTEEEPYWPPLHPQKVSDQDIFFPLNSNSEQREIVEKLQNYPLVVMQGPPGTGKSHNLVNLLAHLIANGKTALVTSHTGKAVSVIDRMLIQGLPDLQDFCLKISPDTSEEPREHLQERIEKILYKISKADRNYLQELLSHSYELRQKVQQTIAKLTQQMHEVSENEFLANRFIRNGHTIVELLEQIKVEREDFAWFVDDVDNHEEITCSNFEFSAAFKRIIEYTPYVLSTTTAHLPAMDSLKRFQRYVHVGAALELIHTSRLDAPTEEFFPLLELLAEHIEKNTDEELHGFLNLELNTLELDARWEMLERILQRIESIVQQSERVDAHEIVGFENTYHRTALCDLQSYQERIKDGKMGFWAKNVTARKLRYIADKVRLNGEMLQTPAQIECVRAWINLEITRDTLSEDWNQGPFKDLLKLDKANNQELLKLAELAKKLRILLAYKIGNWGQIASPQDWDIEKLARTHTALRYYLGSSNLQELLPYFDAVSEYLQAGCKHPQAHQSWSALHEAFRTSDPQRYKQEMDRLSKALELMNTFPEVQQEYTLIHKFVPKLLETLATVEDRRKLLIESPQWSEAYNYKKEISFVRQYLQDNNIRTLYEQYLQLKNDELSLINTTILTKAWLHRLDSFTPEQQQALQDWQQLCASEETADIIQARQTAFAACRSLVPVWIMPMTEVLEHVKVGEMFDYILIDESSQSSIFAFNMLLRAHRAVIVGDNKQITPDLPLTNTFKAQALLEYYFPENALRKRFAPENSLYDIACNSFKGSHIMLREHFRSVSEIITFSNRYFYNEEIRPLKIRNRANKPIYTYKVAEHNYHPDLPDFNLNEAQKLVNKVVELCQDPAYKDLSMGVIALGGKLQANYIFTLLQEQLPAAEILQRRLVAGTPYSFQGDERDIIFISLGMLPSTTTVSLKSSKDAQMINVAFTRARLENHLFRSLPLKAIPKDCWRYKLAHYCKKYKKLQKEVCQQNNPLSVSEGIKKEIAQALRAEGYKVKINYVLTEKLSADLLVSQKNRKLLIDCSGFLHDYNEHIQRKLCMERIGRKYFHLLPSEWHFQPQKVLQQILQQINE